MARVWTWKVNYERLMSFTQILCNGEEYATVKTGREVTDRERADRIIDALNAAERAKVDNPCPDCGESLFAVSDCHTFTMAPK